MEKFLFFSYFLCKIPKKNSIFWDHEFLFSYFLDTSCYLMPCNRDILKTRNTVSLPSLSVVHSNHPLDTIISRCATLLMRQISNITIFQWHPKNSVSFQLEKFVKFLLIFCTNSISRPCKDKDRSKCNIGMHNIKVHKYICKNTI